MTCFSCRVAAKIDIVICKYICVVFILETQLTNFLTSTWPELACSLSAHSWLVSCTVSVPWCGPSLSTHRHHFVLYSPSLCYGLSGDWATVKTKGKKTLKMNGSCGCRLSSTEIRVIKRNAAGAVWQNPPHTYPPTHPPQERFSVSAGATQSGRDSKYSTVKCRMLSPVV